MDLSHIPGLGKKRIEVLATAGITDIPTLLRNIPRNWLDRTQLNTIAQIEPDSTVVLVGTISRAAPVFGKRPRFQAYLRDATGEILLVFFSAVPYWQKRLGIGSRWMVVGKIQEFRGFQIVHPELQPLDAESEFEGGIVSVYSISEEMRASRMEQAFFRKLYTQLFEAPWLKLRDACPTPLLAALKFKSELENLRRIHLPKSMGEVFQGRRQLKVMELLPLCLRMVQRRRRMAGQGLARSIDRALIKKNISGLPFALTRDQSFALETILTGMESTRQFHALLQGDVGSGKTVVAMLAMLGLAAKGTQCAIMVPTDILARQHIQTMRPWFEQAGLRLSLLVGASKGAERNEILQSLANGTIHVVVGTHALFSNDVQYHSLGMVIIDEQHRFGVQQREALLAKGQKPELLVMSATPIPRSLAMTLYGDLDAVVIREKPPGRKPVKTRMVESSKRDDLKAFLLKECKTGNQAYWIVSRVEDDEESEAHSVESLDEELAGYSKEWRVACVHGRMDESERNHILAEFSKGKIQVLVSTTVVEVGVNVPNANLMVIDQPERFGLAQLHQLRGRVGRGETQAWCFLVADPANSAYERLQAFTTTLDGFEISEMDLKFRGAGNLEGSEQSGSWILRWFDWVEDQPLIEEVIRISEKIIDQEIEFDEATRFEIEDWYAGQSKASPVKHDDGVH
jgi:ATP-dependent DNA helicase RecG